MNKFAVALLACTFSIHASAQESTDIPEVKIMAPANTESMVQPSRTKAIQETRSIPGGASVIGSDEYKSGRVSTLKDALNSAPGVFVQSRFGAEEARISIRGSGLQRTFHGRGIRLLQDGVPLNLADGSFDFQAVEPLVADYIEVLRGANASKYGSTSLGGSVNFLSRTGHNTPSFMSRLEGGSFGYGRALISHGAVHDDFDYSISLSQFMMDGFRQHSVQNTQRLFSNAGWKFGANVESRVYVTFVKTDSQLPGNLTKAELDRDPTLAQRSATATSDVITSNQKRDFNLLRLASKTTWKFDDQHRLETGLFWSRKDLHHPIFQVINDLSNDFGVDTRYKSDSAFLDRKNSLTTGIGYTFGSLIDRRYQNVLGNEGAPTADNIQSASNLDIYAENQNEIIEKLTLVTGVQWSTAFRKSEDRFPVSGTDLNNSDEDTFTEFLPKVGLRYELSDTDQVYANYSYSFEPPSFGELTTVANQPGLLNLKAQTAKTIEVGTRGSDELVSWDASYYFAWVENELLSYEVSPGVSRTLNASSTYHQGIELGLDFSITSNLVFKQNYLLSDFHFSADGTYGNGQLAGIPAHFYRTELRYDFNDGYYVSVTSEASLAKYAVDFANTLFADPYAIFGVKAGYAKEKGISAFIEGRNLTGVKYAATTGVIARATASNQSQFLPGDGFSLYAGIQWTP